MNKLGEFLTIKHGWAFKGEFFSETGTQSILTPGNFYEKGGFKYNDEKDRFYTGDYPPEYLCKKGDLIVAMTEQAAGLLGSTAIVPQNNRYLHNQRIGLIKCNKDKLLPLYAYYLFMTKSVREQISRSASGTKVKHTSPEKIYDVEVSIPDIKRQHAVSSFLWCIDSKIQSNLRICKELENWAQILFDYWFTQFDFPDTNGKPYRSSGGAMQWNEQVSREIPKGWIVAPLSQYLNCNKHSVQKKDQLESICYLDTGSLTDNAIDAVEYFESISVAPVRAQRIVHQNDILYSTVRPIQRHYGIIKNPAKNMVASSGFACLSSKSDPKYNDLFYLFITAPHNTKKLCAIADSSVSAYPSINPSDILDLQIALPKDLDEIDELVSTLSSLLSAKAHWQDEIKQLSSLRDWLLPMLMNGQATVVNDYEQASVRSLI